jgi:hypothetical protein
MESVSQTADNKRSEPGQQKRPNRYQFVNKKFFLLTGENQKQNGRINRKFAAPTTIFDQTVNSFPRTVNKSLFALAL